MAEDEKVVDEDEKAGQMTYEEAVICRNCYTGQHDECFKKDWVIAKRAQWLIVCQCSLCRREN